MLLTTTILLTKNGEANDSGNGWDNHNIYMYMVSEEAVMGQVLLQTPNDKYFTFFDYFFAIANFDCF